MKKHLIVPALILAIAVSSCRPAPSTKTVSRLDTVLPVAFIAKDSANKMISSYLGSINATANDTDLHALIIDADQLRLYLASDTGTGRITHLKLSFAHTLSYINSGHNNQKAGYGSGALTLIISGYKANGDYVFFNGTQVEDHSTPCPTNCPPGQAASDLFPQ